MVDESVPGFVFVWFNHRENERGLPLLWLAEFADLRGWKTLPTLVVLDGIERLSFQYRRKLECSWNLIDQSVQFKQQLSSYPLISSRFSDYEVKCFLRWGILAKLHRGRSSHWDGDVVWGDNPDVLTARVAGETFVLQGCPAWTMIGTDQWFESYARELSSLEKNIDEYSSAAWSEWSDSDLSFHTKWAGTRERPLISSDQDLIRHLIHTERLPQQKPAVILGKLSEYALFENPKYVHAYLADRPLIYQRRGHEDFFNKKKVALWHFQSDFAGFAFERLLSSTQSGSKSRLSSIERWSRKFFRMKGLDRRTLYQWFFERYDFSLFFSPENFWAPGIFDEN